MRWCICAVRWLNLKSRDAGKGELLPRLQFNGATAHCAFYVRDTRKGNKPLHDLRIERVKGVFKVRKIPFNSLFQSFTGRNFAVLRLLRTHAVAVKFVLFLCFRWISATAYRVKTQQRSHFDHYSFCVSLCAQCGVSALAALTVNNAEPARRKVFDGFAVYRVVNAIQFQIAPVGGVRSSRPESWRDFSFHCLTAISSGKRGLLVVLPCSFFAQLFSKNYRAQKFEGAVGVRQGRFRPENHPTL